MAQKAITIYTKPEENPHIYAEDEAQINRARFGGSGITEADEMLECEKVTNNQVRLKSGVYSMQGYLICVPGGETETLAVDSGTLGVNRNDLVVAEFNRGGGATNDTLVFKVLKGSPGAGDPALQNDDLGAGGTQRQEALYRLKIVGTALDEIERVAPYVGNFYA